MNYKTVIWTLSAAALVGCSTAKVQHQLNTRLEEESRALTTGVVDALNLQPPERRDQFTVTALQFARQDQRIEGLPIKPFATQALVGGAANLMTASQKASEQKRARAEVRDRFALQDQLRSRQIRAGQKLLEVGIRQDEQHAARVRFWLKWLGGGSLILGGIIALCVFFPVAIPIIGRLLAWLVAKLPALAGAAGVVGVRAFDAVVRAIEQSKTTAESARLGNETGQFASGIDPGALSLNLSRFMDADHKALVRHRKARVA
jgi:hypothetical protein